MAKKDPQPKSALSPLPRPNYEYWTHCSILGTWELVSLCTNRFLDPPKAPFRPLACVYEDRIRQKCIDPINGEPSGLDASDYLEAALLHDIQHGILAGEAVENGHYRVNMAEGLARVAQHMDSINAKVREERSQANAHLASQGNIGERHYMAPHRTVIARMQNGKRILLKPEERITIEREVVEEGVTLTLGDAAPLIFIPEELQNFAEQREEPALRDKLQGTNQIVENATPPSHETRNRYEWTVSDAARYYVQQIGKTVTFESAKVLVCRWCDKGEIEHIGRGRQRRIDPASMGKRTLEARNIADGRQDRREKHEPSLTRMLTGMKNSEQKHQ